jgi:hypothetical protein
MGYHVAGKAKIAYASANQIDSRLNNPTLKTLYLFFLDTIAAMTMSYINAERLVGLRLRLCYHVWPLYRSISIA